MIPFKVQLTNQRVRVVLYRRKSGAPFYAKWHFDGKPYHRSTNAYVEAKARISARKLVEDVALPKIAVSGLTFDTAVKMYLNDRWPTREVGNRTLHDHRSRLNLFIKTAGHIDIGSTSLDQAIHLVQKFIRERKDAGDNPVSQSNCQRVLSRFCTWLLKTRDDSGEPLANWRANPASTFNIEIPDAEFILKPAVPEELIPIIIAEGPKYRVWPALLLCLGAGLRPIEAARLEWTRTNLKTRKLVAKGKGREREIKISDWLLERMSLLPQESKKVYPPCIFEVGHDMRRMRLALKMPATVTLQACRRTACRKAATHMTVEQYAHYFGHSIAVAKKHYIGYGLMGSDANVNQLNFNSTPDKKPDKNGAENGGDGDVSIYEK